MVECGMENVKNTISVVSEEKTPVVRGAGGSVQRGFPPWWRVIIVKPVQLAYSEWSRWS